METGDNARTLLAMLDSAIEEIGEVLLERQAPRHELDAADRVAWMLRHLKEDLDEDLLRSSYVASELVNGVESIGLGRLRRWQETAFLPRLLSLYGFCSVWRERSASRKGSTS